jgi:hypothetical protein
LTTAEQVTSAHEPLHELFLTIGEIRVLIKEMLVAHLAAARRRLSLDTSNETQRRRAYDPWSAGVRIGAPRAPYFESVETGDDRVSSE